MVWIWKQESNSPLSWEQLATGSNPESPQKRSQQHDQHWKLVNLWKSKAQYPFALIALTNSLAVIQQQEGHLTGIDE